MTDIERKEIRSPNDLSPEAHAAEIRGGLESDGWRFIEVKHDGTIIFTRTAEDKKKAEEAKKKLSVVKV